jgi:hypothetical protein
MRPLARAPPISTFVAWGGGVAPVCQRCAQAPVLSSHFTRAHCVFFLGTTISMIELTSCFATSNNETWGKSGHFKFTTGLGRDFSVTTPFPSPFNLGNMLIVTRCHSYATDHSMVLVPSGKHPSRIYVHVHWAVRRWKYNATYSLETTCSQASTQSVTDTEGAGSAPTQGGGRYDALPSPKSFRSWRCAPSRDTHAPAPQLQV